VKRFAPPGETFSAASIARRQILAVGLRWSQRDRTTEGSAIRAMYRLSEDEVKLTTRTTVAYFRFKKIISTQCGGKAGNGPMPGLTQWRECRNGSVGTQLAESLATRLDAERSAV